MAMFSAKLQNNGDLAYTRKKKSALQKAKDVISNLNPTADVEVLKMLADMTHEEQDLIMKHASDPNKPLERGDQLRGRIAHNKDLAKDLAKYQKQLDKQGVKIKGETFTRKKLGFLGKEGGYNDMLTIDELMDMKLEVYEHAAAGNISPNMRDALLEYYEAVAEELAVQEAIMESIEEQRDMFIDYVLDSYDRGLITERQKDYFMDIAVNDNVLYETGTEEEEMTSEELVSRYLEAAENYDEDEKNYIMSKIRAMMEGEDCSDGSCSLKNKVEELKVNLTDDESKTLDNIDSKIQEKLGKKDDEKDKDKSSEKSDDVTERVRNSIGAGVTFNRNELEACLTESVDSALYTDEDASNIRSALDMYYNG